MAIATHAHAGLYCPGCGYDLRAMSSNRCPECGLTIDPSHKGVIVWEQRTSNGYFRSFVRTLFSATFRPTALARAVQWPVDVRSARLFRWIVRGLFLLFTVATFVFAIRENGGIDSLRLVDGPASSQTVRFWEAKYLWCAGATLWPILPVGFVFTSILATGISPWLCMKHLELHRRNRAMAFSYYLCGPLVWVAIPCLAAAAILLFSNQDMADSIPAAHVFLLSCYWIGSLSTLGILMALINSLRAVSIAAQCGIGRTLVAGCGIVVQIAIAAILGLAVFPILAGLFRLIVSSLSR